MLLRSSPSRRRGGTLAESAIAQAIVMLLTVGMVIMALGVACYQQVGELAREGARWAAVHGGQYAAENNATKAAQSDVVNVILQKAVGLDTSQLTTTNIHATWSDTGTSTSNEMPTYVDTTGNVKRNYVTVTISYTWNPALYVGSVTFQCQSVMMMQY
jgi:hypothetical protein